MAKSSAASALPKNRLLALLSPKEYERFRPSLEAVSFTNKQILYEQRASINHVYFPTRCVISAVTIMDSGDIIEVATIGNEGMVGPSAMLGAEESANRLIVQVPGAGLRVEAQVFRAETVRTGALHQIIVRYQTAFHIQVSQAVACNGLHSVHQRCCRWLLMTHDRVDNDEFPITHEFLSHMLGVRRVSVTEVLAPLQDAGLISQRRGYITVRDREGLEAAACECYASVQAAFKRLLGRQEEGRTKN